MTGRTRYGTWNAKGIPAFSVANRLAPYAYILGFAAVSLE